MMLLAALRLNLFVTVALAVATVAILRGLA